MMAQNSPGYDGQYLSQLTRGAEKTFQNAETLFLEAKILSSAGALSRALFLHQISLEECAKNRDYRDMGGEHPCGSSCR
jgi:hypothetical protein